MVRAGNIPSTDINHSLSHPLALIPLKIRRKLWSESARRMEVVKDNEMVLWGQVRRHRNMLQIWDESKKKPQKPGISSGTTYINFSKGLIKLSEGMEQNWKYSWCSCALAVCCARKNWCEPLKYQPSTDYSKTGFLLNLLSDGFPRPTWLEQYKPSSLL